MRFPRMTTQQLLLLILVLALWMGFAARARRFRALGDREMRQFANQSRRVLDLRDETQAEERESARRIAARHKQQAEQYNVEADFVESFTLSLLLSGVAFGVLVLVRNRRRRLAPPSPMAASDRPETHLPR